MLGAVQTAGLLVLVRRLRRNAGPTSRLVGPLMGASLLGFAVLAIVIFVARSGSPW